MTEQQSNAPQPADSGVHEIEICERADGAYTWSVRAGVMFDYSNTTRYATRDEALNNGAAYAAGNFPGLKFETAFRSERFRTYL